MCLNLLDIIDCSLIALWIFVDWIMILAWLVNLYWFSILYLSFFQLCCDGGPWIFLPWMLLKYWDVGKQSSAAQILECLCFEAKSMCFWCCSFQHFADSLGFPKVWVRACGPSLHELPLPHPAGSDNRLFVVVLFVVLIVWLQDKDSPKHPSNTCFGSSKIIPLLIFSMWSPYMQ